MDFPTLQWHKITTINIAISFLVVKVGGNKTHTTFNISRNNTNGITTQSTNWIILTEQWHHGGYCALRMISNKPPIIPDSSSITFFGGDMGCHSTNATSNITSSNLIILPPNIWLIIGTFLVWITHGNISLLLDNTKSQPSIQPSTFLEVRWLILGPIPPLTYPSATAKKELS